jgi:hypothetical protein
MNLAAFVDAWNRVEGGWVCADGYWGIRHPIDGRYLFIHGDTFFDVDGARTMARNSGVVWDGTKLRCISDPVIGLIPAPADGSWFWGGNPVWAYPDLWVMSLHLAPVTGGYGFKSLTRKAVQLSWPTGQTPEVVKVWPDLLASTRGIDWGAAVVNAGRYIFAYGTKALPGEYGCSVYLSHLLVPQMTNPALRTYWTGTAWSLQEADAVPIIASNGGPEATFTAHQVDGGYRLVSKRNGSLGAEAQVWRSTEPWGPWTTAKFADVPWVGNDMTYAANGHYGLGKLAASYLASVAHNRSGVPLTAFYDNPKIYRATWHLLPE